MDIFPAHAPVRLPIIGQTGQFFPARRVYCVGRNFAEHAREMGAAAPDAAGAPVFFLKPTDALTLAPAIPYPPGTQALHHEVELVVALGQDAPDGLLTHETARALVFGYGIGLDLTRRDLQAQAKAAGLPWDTGKSFDHAAPISPLLPKAALPALDTLHLGLEVNGQLRQHGALAALIWPVEAILAALSGLYRLKAGDLIFMGTPAGVAALQPGDHWRAYLNDRQQRPLLERTGSVTGIT